MKGGDLNLNPPAFGNSLRSPLALVLSEDEEGLGLGVVGEELHPGVAAPVPPLPVGRLRLDQHQQVHSVEVHAAQILTKHEAVNRLMIF